MEHKDLAEIETQAETLIEDFLDLSHVLPADILKDVNALFPTIEASLDSPELPTNTKARLFYLKAGLMLLKQVKSPQIETFLLKSVSSSDKNEPR